MSRCKCCNRAMSDTEMLSKKYITDGRGARVKTDIPEDLCFTCRVGANSEFCMDDKEYAFSDLTCGATQSAGFSDNY